MRTNRTLLAVDVVLKLILLCGLLFAAFNTDMERFHEKAMPVRAVIYPLVACLVAIVWYIGFRRRIAFPVLMSICVTVPFLLDAYGNVLNLFDTVVWFDDALHFLNWIPWSLTFGLILRYHPLGRLNVAALTAGYGAITHILWEIGEYFAFVNINESELVGIYPDTIGDLALSLSGAVVAAVLIGTVLWPLSAPQRDSAVERQLA